MFCKHKWEKIHDYTTESQLEHIKNNGFKPNNIYWYLLERKYICVFQCNKCGKLEKIIEEI